MNTKQRVEATTRMMFSLVTAVAAAEAHLASVNLQIRHLAGMYDVAPVEPEDALVGEG
jgi:hypothetical protein